MSSPLPSFVWFIAPEFSTREKLYAEKRCPIIFSVHRRCLTTDTPSFRHPLQPTEMVEAVEYRV